MFIILVNAIVVKVGIRIVCVRYFTIEIVIIITEIGIFTHITMNLIQIIATTIVAVITIIIIIL